MTSFASVNKDAEANVDRTSLQTRNFTVEMSTRVYIGKGKAVPLQAWSGPEGSRKLSIPDFHDNGTG